MAVNKRLILYSVILVGLFAGVWYGVVCQHTWQASKAFTENTITDTIKQVDSPPTNHVAPLPQEKGMIAPLPQEKGMIVSFLDPDKRESVIQVAFGKTLSYMSNAQILEFALSWLLVIMLTIGIVSKVKKHRNIIWLAVASYMLLSLTVLLPYLSNWYGISRVWFTVSPIMFIYIIVGMAYVLRNRMITRVVITVFVVAYSFCTMGLLDSSMGAARANPPEMIIFTVRDIVDMKYVYKEFVIPRNTVAVVCMDVWEGKNANNIIPFVKRMRDKGITILASTNQGLPYQGIKVDGEITKDTPYGCLIYVGYNLHQCLLNRPIGIPAMAAGKYIIVVRDLVYGSALPSGIDGVASHNAIIDLIEINWGMSSTAKELMK